jgi:hypothetical protein
MDQWLIIPACRNPGQRSSQDRQEGKRPAQGPRRSRDPAVRRMAAVASMTGARSAPLQGLLARSARHTRPRPCAKPLVTMTCAGSATRRRCRPLRQHPRRGQAVAARTQFRFANLWLRRRPGAVADHRGSALMLPALCSVHQRPNERGGDQCQNEQQYEGRRAGPLALAGVRCSGPGSFIVATRQELDQASGDLASVRRVPTARGQSPDQAIQRRRRKRLRQLRQPGGFLPGIDLKPRQRRNDAERHSVSLVADRGEEEFVEPGVRNRERGRQNQGDHRRMCESCTVTDGPCSCTCKDRTRKDCTGHALDKGNRGATRKARASWGCRRTRSAGPRLLGGSRARNRALLACRADPRRKTSPACIPPWRRACSRAWSHRG